MSGATLAGPIEDLAGRAETGTGKQRTHGAVAPTPDDVVRQSFDRQRELFARDDSPFAQRGPLAWVEPLEASMIVLDVACGAAHVAEGIAPHVRQVVGIDLTRTLLAVGRRRLAASGRSNVSLLEGSVVRMPFVDASFDLVVCRSALHHFDDVERAVAEMARVCRLGGRVVLSDIVAPSEEVRHSFDALHRRIDPSHRRALLAEEMADALATIVGPTAIPGRPEPYSLPIETMLTEVADRDHVLDALRADLHGGASSGFAPVAHDDTILVTFASAVVHATRSR